MINELEGFEIFVPSYTFGGSRIEMTITKTGCRLSKASLSEIKYPEYVNAFFDRNGKRLMITAADKRMQNTLRLSKQGHCPNTLGQKNFIEMMRVVSGNALAGWHTIPGKKAQSKTLALIFDLKEITNKKE